MKLIQCEIIKRFRFGRFIQKTAETFDRGIKEKLDTSVKSKIAQYASQHKVLRLICVLKILVIWAKFYRNRKLMKNMPEEEHAAHVLDYYNTIHHAPFAVSPAQTKCSRK